MAACSAMRGSLGLAGGMQGKSGFERSAGWESRLWGRPVFFTFSQLLVWLLACTTQEPVCEGLATGHMAKKRCTEMKVEG